MGGQIDRVLPLIFNTNPGPRIKLQTHFSGSMWVQLDYHITCGVQWDELLPQFKQDLLFDK